MWALNNRTRYEAERGFWLDVGAAKHWVVVVKATFDIDTDGQLELSKTLEKPLLTPEYFGEEGFSSLRYELDVGGPKPGTDVIVNGQVYAPGARAVPSLRTSLRVGTRHKVLNVVGERVYERSATRAIRPSAPTPFHVMPIRYERAWGGFDRADPDPTRQKMDARNPVGTGCVTAPETLLGKAVANFEHLDGELDRVGPAGFGALASFWSPRRELAGTYDNAWLTERRPLLPLDFKLEHLLAAPIDQQFCPHLKGGEEVELQHMTSAGALRFVLPKLHFAFITRFDFTKTEHHGKLVTVVIEPEHPRVIMVWQSVLPCHERVDALDETTIREKVFV